MKRGAGRPEGGYFLADGTKVPGATTITGRGKDSGGLLYVAKRNWHEAGRQDRPWDPDAYWSDGDALTAGTIVHQWIEDDIHGNEPTVFDAGSLTFDQARVGFMAYRQWRNGVSLEILETEAPLVSEQFEFGGTLDAIALVNGERVLFDWKTSNATYVDYIAQVAAYRQLVNENYDRSGDGGPVEAGHLLRVGKTYGDFHHHFWPPSALDDGWEWFLHAKGLYTLDRKLKKVAT